MVSGVRSNFVRSMSVPFGGWLGESFHSIGPGTGAYCALAGRALQFACRRRLAVSSILHAHGFAAALAGGGIFIRG